MNYLQVFGRCGAPVMRRELLRGWATRPSVDYGICPPPPLFSRRVWAARTAGACIALLSLLIIAGCEVQDNTPTDTPDDSPQGIYTCDKGKPVMGTPNSATDVEMCAECDDTYHKKGDTTCVANEYACSNGDAAEGRPATHNEQKCDTCDPGYRLENDACSEGSIGNACDTNNHCQSTYCNTHNNICSNGVTGTDACAQSSDCQQFCNTHTNKCIDGQLGTQCAANSNCESEFCGVVIALGSLVESLSVCTDGSLTSLCFEDSNCRSDICGNSTCTDGSTGSGCNSNSDCNDKFCDQYNNKCTDGSIGSTCGSNDDCANNNCSSNIFTVEGTCTDGSTGSGCSSNEQCLTNQCYQNICSDGSAGSACNATGHCTSNICTNNICE